MSEMLMAMPVSIDGPLPLAPPYGLVKSVPIIPDGDEHWLNGADVWGYPPAVPSSVAGCAEGTFRTKDDGVAATNPRFGAFTVYLPFECTTRSFRNYDELKSRLLLAFDAADSFAVEQEFANGFVQPLNPFLGDPNMAALAGGAAVPSGEGLAYLEDAIGATGRQGVIHATPASVSAWDTKVMKESGKLRTMNGSLVVSGDGYIGAQPSGEAAPAAGEGWAFATGPVQIRRTEPFIPQDQIDQALNRAVNTVVLYAERYYLVTWDAELQAGVLIDWTS